MIEPLGCPHLGPLPVGEGDKHHITDSFYPYPGTYGESGESV
jgi:hypothetical protein